MCTLPKFTQKFDARVSKKIFVGYTEESTNYWVYDPESKKVSIARNVVFNEKVKAPSAKKEEKEEKNEVTLPRPKTENENKNENGNVIDAERDDGDNEEREEEDNDEAEERGNEPARESPRTLRDCSKI